MANENENDNLTFMELMTNIYVVFAVVIMMFISVCHLSKKCRKYFKLCMTFDIDRGNYIKSRTKYRTEYRRKLNSKLFCSNGRGTSPEGHFVHGARLKGRNKAFQH